MPTADRICPTCHRPIPPFLQVGGTRRQAFVDYMAKHPEGATVRQIISAIYADDPNGGPTDHNIVSVMAHVANQRLKKFGWQLRGTGGLGSRWFLEQIK